MFKQRHFLTRFTFELSDTGVLFSERGLTTSRSYRIPYENIPGDPETVTVSSKWRLVVTALCLAFSLATAVGALGGADVERGAWLIWGILGAVAGLAYAMARNDFFVFRATAGSSLVVMKHRPSPQAVDDFLRTLRERQQAYLREHYLLGSLEGAAADAIHKLHWLRQQGAISDIEFAVLKAQALSSTQGARPGVDPPLH